MRVTKILAGAIAFSLVAAPAFAQRKTDEEKKHEAELRQQEDRLYRSSTANIRTQEIAIDPWANMRGDGGSSDKKKK